jgi:hypothetical protein
VIQYSCTLRTAEIADITKMIFTSDTTNKKDLVDFFRDLYPKTILTAWPHSNLTIPLGGGGLRLAFLSWISENPNPPYIDVCHSVASETGLKSRNVEKRINAV